MMTVSTTLQLVIARRLIRAPACTATGELGRASTRQATGRRAGAPTISWALGLARERSAATSPHSCRTGHRDRPTRLLATHSESSRGQSPESGKQLEMRTCLHLHHDILILLSLDKYSRGHIACIHGSLPLSKLGGRLLYPVDRFLIGSWHVPG
jgi:hypothetical protein